MKLATSLHGLLALVAVMLALNLLATLLRPGDGRGAATVFPQAQAHGVLKLDGPQFITTNQDGSVIYIWELGRFVGDGYESVKVQTFDSSGTRVR